MRLAIIDLGTNSVRFDIHQLGPRRSSHLLHREKIMIRLGQGVFTKGHLDHDAIHRTTHAFLAFKRMIKELSVHRVIAMATSALREAVDGARLVAHLRKITGIDVRVIPGDEEARLIALGIIANEKMAYGKAGFIDIGGGSTEISIVKNKKIHFSESFQLGTARLQQVFLKKSPPSLESLDQLRLYIRKTLSTKLRKRKSIKVNQMIGSSGTIRALVKIIKKTSGKKSPGIDELHELIKRMSRMTTTQLLGIPGMESKRVDMIVAGGVLLEECMHVLGAKRIHATEYSLRDGILDEQLKLSHKKITSQIELHWPDLIEKAKRLSHNGKNIKETLVTAEVLFKRLQSIHKLDPNWGLYLKAAVILRNIGEAISLIGHPEHSYYIVKQSKFPFIETWESELVAELCRYHESHKIDFKTLPFKKEPTRQRSFLKLLAILCLVDALDADPNMAVKIKRVRLGKKDIKIYFSKGSCSDLEVFRVDQRKVLFEQVYKRKIHLLRV